MSNAKETIGNANPDILVYSNQPVPDTKTLKLASGQGELKRGTVIAFTEAAPASNGKAWDGTAGQIADCILCDDVDTGTTAGNVVVGHAYRVGHLCRQAIKFGAGATELTDAAEKQLHNAGILLSNAVL